MASLDQTTAQIGLFADESRLRLLGLLDGVELTVAQLQRITELTQSRVSTHLGKLRKAGLLLDRKAGSSTFYTVNESMDATARALWQVVAVHLDDRTIKRDKERCAAVLRAREGEPWPEAVAGEMERHYSPGRTWEAMAFGLLGLVQLGDVLDVGSGDGVVATLLAPNARSYTCLDRSDKVLDAARERLEAAGHSAEFTVGDMHELPFAPGSFDHVLLFHALTYADRPRRAIEEAHRVLRPGGTLVILTLAEHDQEEIASAYSHRNLGFSPSALRGLLHDIGFWVTRCRITSRERQKPYFEVLTAYATRAS